MDPQTISAAPATTTRPPLGSTVPETVKSKLKQGAEGFEAFYIQQFITLMKPKGEDTVLSGGVGEEMFRDKLTEEMAKNMAKNGGFGLGTAVYNELLKQQEAQAH